MKRTRLPGRRTHLRLRPALTLAVVLLGAPPQFAAAEDMTRFLDLKSDEFTKADMTRSEVAAALAAAASADIVDLSGRRLNRLDLSGMDLQKVKLQAARLNGTRLVGANLDGVVWIKHGR